MEAEVYDAVEELLVRKQTRRLKIALECESPSSMLVHIPVRNIIWAVWDYVIGPKVEFVWDIVEPVVDRVHDNSELDRQFEITQAINLSKEQTEPTVIVHVCGKCGENKHICDCPATLSTSSSVAAERLSSASWSNTETGKARRETECNANLEVHQDSESFAQIANNVLGVDCEHRIRSQSGVSHSSSIGFVPSANDGSRRLSCDVDLPELDLPETSACFPISKDSSTSTVGGAGSTEDLHCGEFAGNGRCFLEDVRELSFSSSDLQQFTPQPHCPKDSVAPIDNNTVGLARSVYGPIMEATCDEPENCITDEQYVATHSLSEMCRVNLDPQTVTDFKLLAVPERQLFIASYIFSARYKDGVSVQSLSLLLADGGENWNWFLRREKLSSDWMNLAIMRLKAYLAVESPQDILSRLTAEMNDFVQLMYSLDLYGLHAYKFNIFDTLFATAKFSSDVFVRNCISGHLQTQGTSVVTGADVKRVNQMLRTLALFSTDDERCISRYLVPNKQLPYSPLLKLQGVPQKFMKLVHDSGALASFPVCLIDIDSRSVVISSQLPRHLVLQKQAMLCDVERALGMDEKTVKLEWKINKFDSELVSSFLHRISLLSQDCAILQEFVKQFNRHLAHNANAMIVYVEETTECGLEENRLVVSKMRRALDLQKDTDFWIVLATADRLQPGFAAFLSKCMH